MYIGSEHYGFSQVDSECVLGIREWCSDLHEELGFNSHNKVSLLCLGYAIHKGASEMGTSALLFCYTGFIAVGVIYAQGEYHRQSLSLRI